MLYPGAVPDLAMLSAMPFDLICNEHVHTADTYKVSSLTETKSVLDADLAGKSCLIKLSSKTGNEQLNH